MAFTDEGESLEPYLNRKTLFVKDIEPGHSKNDIKAELLSLCPPTHGKICVPVDHQTAQPLNYAYCNFNRREEAEEAFRHWRFCLKVKGKQVRVTFAVEKKENLDRVCGPWGRKFFIVVRNLQPEITAASLCKHFEEFGEVFFCKVDDDHYGNRYGVIQYVHEKSVRHACEQANNAVLHGSLGSIQVELLKNSNTFPVARYSLPNMPTDIVNQSMHLSVTPMMANSLPGRLSSGSIGNYAPPAPSFNIQPGGYHTLRDQYSEYMDYPTSEDRGFDSSTDTHFSVPDTYMYPAGQEGLSAFHTTTSPFSQPQQSQQQQSQQQQLQQQQPQQRQQQQQNGYVNNGAMATLGGSVHSVHSVHSDIFPVGAPAVSEPFPSVPVLPYQEATHRSFPASTGSLMDDFPSKTNSQDAASRRPALKACVAIRAVYKQMERMAEMLCCPITQEKFLDPVIAADGHSYERKAIEAWLETNHTSPLTNEDLPHKVLFANRLLKVMVTELVG